MPEKRLFKQLQSAKKNIVKTWSLGVIGSAYMETQYDNLSHGHFYFSLEYYC